MLTPTLRILSELSPVTVFPSARQKSNGDIDEKSKKERKKKKNAH